MIVSINERVVLTSQKGVRTSVKEVPILRNTYDASTQAYSKIHAIIKVTYTSIGYLYVTVSFKEGIAQTSQKGV
jgi:hypothetical protein